jgi:hypothetical protein
MRRFIATRGHWHVEDKVLQRACLCHLPVDPRRYQLLIVLVRLERHLGEVEDEVSDLAEELVLVLEPVPPITSRDVRIRVDQGNAYKRAAALDSRRADSVADELGVVELDNGRAYFVRARL